MKSRLSKYQRQIALKSFGIQNQEKLFASRVLIIGMGGLGIPVSQYLNAMGVGTLGLMDQDTIAIHNLQRQVLYSEQEVGQLKVEVASKKLQQQNSDTKIKAIPEFLTRDNALGHMASYDLVVDASDNFATRYLVNDACVLTQTPFVYGALHDFEGQVSVFNHKGGPTYRCLFPNPPGASEIPNCDENGVLGVLPGIIGNLQALEAIKVLTGVGEPLSGKLLLFNGLTQENRLVQFKAIPENQMIQYLEERYETPDCSINLEIDVADFMALPEHPQLFDVRSAEAFRGHHLEHAMNIPLPELESQLDRLDLTRPLYFICQSGKRSRRAAETLSRRYPSALIYSISGGMNEIMAL